MGADDQALYWEIDQPSYLHFVTKNCLHTPIPPSTLP